jgi:lysozyme family protein
MVAANFDTCFHITLQWEGGYSNDADDPGGPTNLGIIQKEYNVWRSEHGQTLQSVRWITEDEAKAIYKAKYWDAIGADNLPSGYDLAAWDCAVNNGVGRAKQFMPLANGDIDTFCDLRLRFDQRLGHLWAVFGKGWSTRITGIRQQAKTLAAGKPIWDTKRIQEALNKLGASPQLVVDGVKGPATETAIRLFQVGHNLKVDGIAGEQTLTALETALALAS